jgi:hypothetical protein
MGQGLVLAGATPRCRKVPLLDHFHPPLSRDRHWESFHAAWLGSLADDLNRRLPPRYFAEEQVHVGQMEIDIATLDQGDPIGNGASETAWPGPPPIATVPTVFADDFEVRIFSTTGGPQLVAAIELVSPRNKDRSAARRAFAIKCANYLHQGVGLLIVDVVTERHANLHNEILDLLEGAESGRLPDKVFLYAAAYRPVLRETREEIDLWPSQLEVGGMLPSLPLSLGALSGLMIDLEATYSDARMRRRL